MIGASKITKNPCTVREFNSLSNVREQQRDNKQQHRHNNKQSPRQNVHRPPDRTHCTASTSTTELKEQNNGLHLVHVSCFKALMSPSAGSVCGKCRANFGPWEIWNARSNGESTGGQGTEHYMFH